MAALEVQVVDVGTEGFGDAQPVEGEQRRQGVVPGGAQPGLDEERAELVAVQAQGAGLVVDSSAAHVRGRVALDDALLLAVPVEAGQGGQPPGRPSSASGPLLPSSGRTARGGPGARGQLQVGLAAPGREEPQIGGVAPAGGAAVAGQETGDSGNDWAPLSTGTRVVDMLTGSPSSRPRLGREEGNTSNLVAERLPGSGAPEMSCGSIDLAVLSSIRWGQPRSATRSSVPTPARFSAGIELAKPSLTTGVASAGSQCGSFGARLSGTTQTLSSLKAPGTNRNVGDGAGAHQPA